MMEKAPGKFLIVSLFGVGPDTELSEILVLLTFGGYEY